MLRAALPGGRTGACSACGSWSTPSRLPSSRWAGTALGQLASSATKNLVRDQRAIAVLVIAVVGAALRDICGGEAHADHRDWTGGWTC